MAASRTSPDRPTANCLTTTSSGGTAGRSGAYYVTGGSVAAAQFSCERAVRATLDLYRGLL